MEVVPEKISEQSHQELSFQANGFEKNLNVVLGEALMQKQLTIATAESCTGGLIAAKLAEIPGISASLQMGLVTYSNEAKMQLLHVRRDTLMQFGAVSYQTCKEMCEHLSDLSNCDVAVSVTGIAGPGGGSAEKPVGLVYIGVCYQNHTHIYQCHFTDAAGGPLERTCIQQLVLNTAYRLILEKISE